MTRMTMMMMRKQWKAKLQEKIQESEWSEHNKPTENAEKRRGRISNENDVTNE